MIANNHIFLSKIAGKLLGDGSITVQKGRKPRFQFTHCIKDKGWSIHSYIELKGLIPLSEPRYRKVIDPRTKAGYTEGYYVLSKTSPIITQLESIWYHNRIKVVPMDFLEKYFNNLTLAWWFQDDGHLKLDKHTMKPRKIILSTDSFTKQENNQLINLLKRKYTITFTLDKQNRLIIYDATQILYFLHLVQPHIHHSMYRKTIPLLPLHDKVPIKAKRTTIYLPEEIKITKPTQELNQHLVLLSKVLRTYKKGDFYNYLYPLYIKELKNINRTNSYQILIQPRNLLLLNQLKSYTGFTYSELATLCFLIAYRK
ncbi:hypothetical protein HNQ94_002070 [Salirhabdus euzebyi]|uniref:Homing endonuclease LAGLIDADG domain-containing protein n=1 Tax=Salirhabdus euzebyi TaxID=394506 RepID=A0A841Q5E6_9BACI|nr:endonuclease [Salirhabdus euzebyi]MBB6453621.1 hypothetical protein [Salirhabdus euzebyi]